jgi:hypothetical protein
VAVAGAERHQLREVTRQLEALGLDLDEEVVEAARNHGREHPAGRRAHAAESVRRPLGDHRHRAGRQFMGASVAPDLIVTFEDLERFLHPVMDVARRPEARRRRFLPHCEVAAGVGRRHPNRQNGPEHVHLPALARPGDDH